MPNWWKKNRLEPSWPPYGKSSSNRACVAVSIATAPATSGSPDGPVNPSIPTASLVGRALKQLGIRLIPAYSPQARGRMERNYRTWQGRLPQELRRAQIRTLTEANQFLRQRYITEFNQQFAVPASQPGTAFVRCRRRDLDWVFSLQHPRTVNQDNTVVLDRRLFQIPKTRWHLAGGVVTIHEHLDGRVSIRYGPHLIGLWQADQLPLQTPKPSRAVRLPTLKPPRPPAAVSASPPTRQGSPAARSARP